MLNRGARSQRIFLDDDCFIGFTNLLAQLPERFGVRVHGYALMPNHFHLMIESVRGNLSRAMQFLQSRYSVWLNARYEWDGPLFKRRFKNKVVQDDIYWAHLLAYLHLNWIRAHLAGSPDEVDWTSHKDYVGLRDVPSWLTVSELQELFVSREAYIQYLEDVQWHREQTPVGFDAVLFYPSDWDGRKEDGEESTEAQGTRDHELDAAPSTSGVRHIVPPEEGLIAVSMVTGRPRAELKRGRSGRRSDNRARWLAMWWLNEVTALSQAKIGRLLEANPAVVSRSIDRVRRQRDEDPQLAEWMTKLVELGGGGRS